MSRCHSETSQPGPLGAPPAFRDAPEFRAPPEFRDPLEPHRGGGRRELEHVGVTKPEDSGVVLLQYHWPNCLVLNLKRIGMSFTLKG